MVRIAPWLLLLAACAYDAPPLVLGDGGDGGMIVDAPQDGGDGGDAGDGGNGACTTDDACASGVCEASMCVGADLVRYVAVTGVDNEVCSFAMPCRTVARALASGGPDAVYVGIMRGTYRESIVINRAGSGEVVLVSLASPGSDPPTFDLSVIAPAAPALDVLKGNVRARGLAFRGGPSSAVASVRARANSNLTLERVSVASGAGTGLRGEDATVVMLRSDVTGNAGLGVEVVGGDLSMIATTVRRNAGGGVAAEAASCGIASCFVVENGNAMSAVGGVQLRCDQLVFAHNTVADNAAAVTASAYACAAGMGFNLNNLYGSSTATVTGCTHSGSQWASGTAPAGTGNRIALPGFASTGNYHLSMTSAARGAALPGLQDNIPYDIDGEARVQGQPDIGADEIP